MRDAHLLNALTVGCDSEVVTHKRLKSRRPLLALCWYCELIGRSLREDATLATQTTLPCQGGC